MSEDMAAECRCNTCKATFVDIDKVKEHYRSDWHVLNSKRRANGLIPLSKAEYKRALPMIEKKRALKPALPANPNQSPKPPTNIPTVETPQPADEEEEEDIDENIPEEELLPTASIFDRKTFETMDECVDYMGLTYGFFIPEIEYLVDMNGFLSYLNEKVKAGHICLYCQRKFKRSRSCQNHMISKSHCKIAYSSDTDIEEFEDFYDFSSSYEDAEENECDEDGNPIEEKSLEISPIGELVLADGRVVGHRMYRRYYKQKFHQEETRESVLAYQREELLRLGALQFGGQQIKAFELKEMSETLVMTLLLQRQKEIRRSQMIEQRSKQKREFVDMRREYKSTVDKLRSSETTTAKIRDYHSRLV
jgi:pre-60S factor REI1